MESSPTITSLLFSDTNQLPIQIASSDFGYLTPPQTNIPFQEPSTILFSSQPNILTSAELKRRFSPIHSSVKKRRRHLIELQINRTNDCIVPLQKHLSMSVISQKLFDDKEELSILNKKDDSVVPSLSSMITLKSKYVAPIIDSFISNSCKMEQENSFSISETMMKQKLKILLQKK